MRYYVCLYVSEDKWWKRHRTTYFDWDSAYSARCAFLADSEVNPYVMGNKIVVWEKAAWDRLADGYKHPDDRRPMSQRLRRDRDTEKIDHHDEIKTEIGRQLKELGL